MYLEESIPIIDLQSYFPMDKWVANVIEFTRGFQDGH
jgi:hypothetical protein